MNSNASKTLERNESSLVAADEPRKTLPLYDECDENRPRTWILDPPEGRHSFCFVVNCRPMKSVTSAGPRPLASYFSAVVQAVLTLFAFWHTRP